MKKYFISCCLFISFSSLACQFTMGYRMNERLPLIEAMPSDEGLYKELYQQAITKIDCQLQIVRAPKKRLLKMLEEGTIDFYPGFSFTQSRSHYTFYFENGLDNDITVISSAGKKQIDSVDELFGQTVLVARGSATFEAKESGAIIVWVENLSVSQAILFLLNNKADYYIYYKSNIDFYLKDTPNVQIKRHACCGLTRPMLLGFSKKSPHFFAQKNFDYDSSRPLSAGNYPVNLSVYSKAYQLQQVLQQMKKNGTIEALYHKYYRDN